MLQTAILHNYDMLQIFPYKNVSLGLLLFSSWDNQYFFYFILHNNAWRQDRVTQPFH